MFKEQIIDKVKNKITEYKLDKIPNSYQDTIINVVYECCRVFGDNLINMTLGGSCGKNEPINGWSDIDIYVILKTFDVNQMIKLNYDNFNSDIHVGLTFYTIKEVERDLVDFRTRVMFFERTKEKVNPVLYGKDMLPEVTFNEIVKNDRLNFPNILHKYRRILIELTDDETLKFNNKHIKQLTLLLKMILYSENIYVYGYENVFRKFSEYCLSNNFQLPTIINFDIIKVIKELDDSKEILMEYSFEILRFIEEMKIFGGVNNE